MKRRIYSQQICLFRRSKTKKTLSKTNKKSKLLVPWISENHKMMRDASDNANPMQRNAISSSTYDCGGYHRRRLFFRFEVRNASVFEYKVVFLVAF